MKATINIEPRPMEWERNVGRGKWEWLIVELFNWKEVHDYAWKKRKEKKGILGKRKYGSEKKYIVKESNIMRGLFIDKLVDEIGDSYVIIEGK